MEVSVIIPTYQGRHKLPVVLGALKSQSFQNFELIVVVDGSTDNTEEFLKGMDCVDRVVVQSNHGRAHVRNTGARAASGSLLIFYDDDMEPTSESVARHVSFHQNHPHALCGGNQLESSRGNKSDLQHYKEWITMIWLKKFRGGVQLLHAENLFFTGANCSMAKTTWEGLNGFNEGLTDAEDYELAMRAMKSGISVFLDTHNIAYHHDPITWESYVKRLNQYRAAHQKIGCLDVKRKPGLLKEVVYRFLSRPGVLTLVENSRMLKLLPKAVRYRLYSAVLHAQTTYNSTSLFR